MFIFFLGDFNARIGQQKFDHAEYDIRCLTYVNYRPIWCTYFLGQFDSN